MTEGPARPSELLTALRSSLICPFRPASAAIRTLSLSLPAAYVVHFFSALGIVAAVIAALAWSETNASDGFRGFLVEMHGGWGEFVSAFVDNAFPLTFAALAIELGYASLALWALPWGACDEPLKDSIRHALRRVWMQTPQLLLFVALMAGLIASLDRAQRQWTSAYGYRLPPAPVMPVGTQYGTPQWTQWQAQMTVHQDNVRVIIARQNAVEPWYVRSGPGLAVAPCFALGLLFLACILRAAGAPRRRPPIERSPHCEACGYNLTTIPLESRCPECGEAVMLSLGPQARPGPPWQDAAFGIVSRWHRTWRAAVLSPAAFGRTLRAVEAGVAHRRYLLGHLPIVFLIAACSPPLAFYAVEHHWPEAKDLAVVALICCTFGILCVVGAVSMTVQTAMRLGFYFWWKEKRNLLLAAMQATCYLAPFLIAWELFGAATGIVATALGRSAAFRDWVRARNMHEDAVLVTSWIILNLIWLVCYSILARRATAAMRYANR